MTNLINTLRADFSRERLAQKLLAAQPQAPVQVADNGLDRDVLRKFGDFAITRDQANEMLAPSGWTINRGNGQGAFWKLTHPTLGMVYWNPLVGFKGMGK